ncbi:MAG TPA: haloacid dehalogenase-like hydrolase [Thermoanaerobaculia bacterium]|nr:haloacid dehalogenase-like hydrolase [Thermoanaerobaculia bacterium]
MPRRLVLFDIDGTLITDSGAARHSYGLALRETYGFEGDLSRYDFSGRTDPQITSMVLHDAGFTDEEIAARAEQLWKAYLRELAVNATAERVRVLPGIRDLIERLVSNHDVLLALLTGNIEPGARLKLAPAGLNHFFPFGAFGSDSANREELPPIAVERASKIDGHRFRGRDVVIIGDSIYDVRCGVPHDATTIAIASGKTPAEKLRAEKPHHFFHSAENLAGILEAIRW